jgi:hypothetical protein
MAHDAASATARASAAGRQWAALTPALAARQRMRMSHDGGRSYPRRLDAPLTAGPPPYPAALYIYDADGETRVLAADFDVKRAAAAGSADPAGQVAAEAAALAALIRACGGRGFGDVSPNGGRHGYLLWAEPVPYGEMRRVALALARRYPSLDPTPMLGRQDGIIRPPGSRHRTGGFQALTSSLAHALRCVADPNGPAVWERLCAALSTELAALERGDSSLVPPGGETAPDGATCRTDDAGSPWLQRPSDRAHRLRSDLELTAITGGFDTARYPTPSEARFAVLSSAAARGWRLHEVAQQMRSGAWAGLAACYSRYRTGRQRQSALTADWRKAVGFAARKESGPTDHTSENNHRGGSPPCGDLGSGVDAYQEIRQWDCALRTAERHRWQGAHGITVRLVLRAVGAAAQMSGRTAVEFGTRSLGLLACLDNSTVARVLRELCKEDDPFLVLLEGGRGLRGDLYLLRIPETYAVAAAWRRWRPGRIGVHPAFRVLGGAAALVCEQLTGVPVRTNDLPVLTGLSASTVSTALASLARHGIAARGPGGWRRGPAGLDEVADQLRVPEVVAEIQARYRREREEWRGLLTLAPTAPVAPPDDDDIPWPEAPASDLHGDPAAARAPPDTDPARVGDPAPELGAPRVHRRAGRAAAVTPIGQQEALTRSASGGMQPMVLAPASPAGDLVSGQTTPSSGEPDANGGDGGERARRHARSA